MEKLLFKKFQKFTTINEIKSSARDPGSRAKICVKAIDTSLDPVGACVEWEEAEFKPMVNELQGEKIDIVNWSEEYL